MDFDSGIEEDYTNQGLALSEEASIASVMASLGAQQEATQTNTDGYGDSVPTSIALDGSNTAVLSSSVWETVYPTDSTLATSTTFSSQGHDVTQAYGNTESTTSSTPFAQDGHHAGSSSLSSGALAAAIVFPIIAVLALCALASLLRRRRRRTRDRPNSPTHGLIPGVIKEKWDSLHSSSSSDRPRGDNDTHDTSMPGLAPVVTTAQNTAYFTGLDTSSQNSNEYDHEHDPHAPPPPYIKSPADLPTHSPPMLTIPDLGHSLLSPDASDPPMSSGRSARSFTSTLYSDTASVHSARAARMSVGGVNMISSSEGPFGDGFEAATPVSARSQ